jgi:hypothetical protein
MDRGWRIERFKNPVGRSAKMPAAFPMLQSLHCCIRESSDICAAMVP